MSSGPGWNRARKYEPTAAGSRGSALTCAITLDDPAALPNYLQRGFRPYRTETYMVEKANTDR